MSETTATDTTEDTTTTTDTETDGTTTEGETALGDAGKKALDAMKAQRKAAETDAREARNELARIKAELALKDKPAEEQALEQARAEARAEATTAANERLLKSELRAAAKGKLADPADAALFINLSEFTVSDDGEVDAVALDEAIDDLIVRKPHLAAAKQTRFDGSADQGAAGKETNNGPKQLTREDLVGMSPAQIVAADEAGQLRKLYGFTK